MFYERQHEISDGNYGACHNNRGPEYCLSSGEDISDLKKLISVNEDVRMNSQDLAFFLVTHNYSAFRKMAT